MTERIRTLDFTPANMCEAPICEIKGPQHEGRLAKERWLKTALKKGLKARVLLRSESL